jgi:predicted AAA+ superfamily ATPase
LVINTLRQEYLSLIETHFKIHKVCALLGPRQCGKTTLSRQFADGTVERRNRYGIMKKKKKREL